MDPEQPGSGRITQGEPAVSAPGPVLDLPSWERPQSAPPAPQPLSAWIVPAPVQLQPAPGYLYAGFLRRFWAYVADGVIVGIPFWIISAAIWSNPTVAAGFGALLGSNAVTYDPATGTYLTNPAAIAAFGDAFGKVVPLLALSLIGQYIVQSLYFGLLWSRRGASLGQELLGIEVRNQLDGSRLTFGRGCRRVFGYLVAGAFADIGFIFAIFDPRKQGWHDKIAGTVVVTPVKGRGKPAPAWITVIVILSMFVGFTGVVVTLGQLSLNRPASAVPDVQPADDPPAGAIWIGASLDRNTFALSGRTTTPTRGDSEALVAHLSRDVEDEDISVHTIVGGKDTLVDSYHYNGPGDLYAVDLEGALFNVTGQMTIDIHDSAGHILAITTLTFR